jgi:hypothetical protein
LQADAEEVKMLSEKDIIKLEPVRKKKQQEYDRALEFMYVSYFSYLRRHANIREKVRAKHIFREQTGLSQEQLLEKTWENQFEHWFAFDYRNIQGGRMFDLYLKEEKKRMTEPMFVLAALLLTIVLEPIIVEGVYHKGKIKAVNPFEKKPQIIFGQSYPFSDIRSGDLLFIRKIKSAYQMTMLGPYLRVPHTEKNRTLEQLDADYKKFLQTHEEATLRTFLKASALQYINL